MGASLIEQRRVKDEGLRIVNFCCKGRTSGVGNGSRLTVPYQKATANYVPAAAVIRRWQALSGFTGRKASAVGLASLMLKPGAQPRSALETVRLELWRG